MPSLQLLAWYIFGGESRAKIAYEISRISEIPQNLEGISGRISLDLSDFKKFDIERYVLQLNPFCKVYPFHSNDEDFSRISVHFLL